MIITHFLTNLTYLISDHQERLCEESLKKLNSHQFNVHDEFAALNIPYDTFTPTSVTPKIETKINYETLSANLISMTKQSMASFEYIFENREHDSEREQVLEMIRLSNETSDFCSLLVLYYIIECIDSSDLLTLKYLLSIARMPINNPNFEKWFLCQFISSLCENPEAFKHEWFQKLIFEQFLVKLLKSDFNFEIIYKLIESVHQHISTNMFSHLLDEVKPRKNVSRFYKGIFCTNKFKHFNRKKCASSVQTAYSRLKLKYEERLESKSESNNNSLIFISPKV
jgi:hypothetical protein